jgi:hypothetical protein
MPNLQTKYAVTVRRGHGSLPIGLKFVNLVRSQGVETIRIRFSLNHDKVLDLPLSADTLAELAYTLGALRGVPPENLPEEIEDLAGKGLAILPE